jgi:hypothetical protein
MLMASREQAIVFIAFVLVGTVVGYATFLIFRMSAHEKKFNWSGALSVITVLGGGGFLSYLSQPLNFAAYGIGFFLGFTAYWLVLQFSTTRPGICNGSNAAPFHHSYGVCNGSRLCNGSPY